MISIDEIEFKALKMSLDLAGLQHGGFEFADYAGLVKNRVLTGVGFNTEFIADKRLAIPGVEDARAIGNVAGLLNETIEVGFMVKLEHGSVVWMEGYIYGDGTWPDTVTACSLSKDDVAII